MLQVPQQSREAAHGYALGRVTLDPPCGRVLISEQQRASFRRMCHSAK